MSVLIEQMTGKHLTERTILEKQQHAELISMMERHRKETEKFEPSKYFFQKRLDQLSVLRARHKAERDRLYDNHTAEYDEYYKLQTILRQSKVLSAEQEKERLQKIEFEQKRELEIMQKVKPEPEEQKSLLEKIKSRFIKSKSKTYEPER